MDGLAARRSRRSTAGNRMEAALAEMALDDSTKDLDDDKEFINERDEEDMFESDFASTDEEAEQGDPDAGEKVFHDEEKSARRAVRARLEKQTAAAHARQKATFNPQAVAPPVVKPNLDATVIVSEAGQELPRRIGQKRKSQRKHTMLNTNATDTRAREAGEKKASAPKKFKPAVHSFSQAELIQRALDNEEGNIKEHKNYLQVEEEKRKKARVIKMPAVEGPLLRWVSKVEDEKFKVNVEVKTTQPPPAAAPSYPNYTQNYYNTYYTQLFQYLAAQATPSTSGSIPQASSTSQPAPGQTSTSQLITAPSTTSQSTSVNTQSSTPVASTPITADQSAQSTASTFSTFRLPPAPSTYPYGIYNANPTTTAGGTGFNFHSSLFTPTTLPTPTPPQPKQYVEEERTEKVAKNYVIHENDQREGVSKPQWKDTMSAMFGDHVKWEELKVLGGKGRPLGRLKQRCAITGQVAPYLDPRTGAPFADVDAFRVLTDVLEHHYTWSPEFGCYVGRDEEC
ncbi:transcriptional regulator family: YL1 nuclear protein [Agaricus bisporus var. burnettii]|uniref:Transcriptional regulator family: YL1 nuclear protein n=1 Tax=Agaricus bisporus var. burnettii TaxID=192524 RepID=A0A8H7FBL0_AGABI|nr:transcriptional regulator family: YL1 nuclear protein [Agaricus bisporus var. burnettii]